MEKEYAVYHDDEFIGIGTTKELAELMNVMPRTILFYRTNAYQKRPKGRGYVIVDLGVCEDEKNI